MIEHYIEAVKNNDCKALASYFDSKCKYFDYCATTPYHVYGDKALEMFFHNQFFFRTFKLYDYVIESDNCANFMVSYNGVYMHVRATIEKVNEQGLITQLTVRTA